MKSDKTTDRPWRSLKPVHETFSGWKVSLANGPIPAARAVGVTRSHAIANANLISRAVIVNDRVSRLLAKKPESHEEARFVGWLKDQLL